MDGENLRLQGAESRLHVQMGASGEFLHVLQGACLQSDLPGSAEAFGLFPAPQALKPFHPFLLKSFPLFQWN